MGFLLLFAATSAVAAWPVVNIDRLDTRTLGDPVEFFVADRESTLDSLHDASFLPLTPAFLNQGINDRTYWLRVRLSNPSDRARAWVLHHETAYLDKLTIFHADSTGETGVLSLSDRRPFAERPLDFRKLGFQHVTPAGGHTDLYLRLGNDKPDAVSLGFQLHDAALFFSRIQGEHLIQGAYFGVMSILLFLALLTAATLKQTVYLHYAAFLFVSALMWAMLHGFAFQYLWPGSVFWHNEGFHIVYLLVAITALQFSRGFLQTAQIAPRVHRVLAFVQWLMFAGILLRFAGLYEPVLWMSYVSLSLLGMLPLLGFHAYRQGLRYARWYAIAWLFYSAGLIVSVLSAASSAIFEWGMEPLIYAQAGGMLEAVMLLVALGERLTGWDRDRQRAVRLAHHDPLTGLGNRRRLLQAFDLFRTRFAKSRVPVFVMMIDLDHFKEINDTYGHDAGDAVLRDVAVLLARLSRPEDVCIRYGGEEFAVLFQAPSAAAAMEIAERIRTEFAAFVTRHREHVIRHTLSAGVAQVLSSQESLGIDEMMIRADSALYRSKAAGRNRVTMFGADTTAGAPAFAS